MAAFATLDEYRLDTGDSSSDDERVQAVLAQQSAKLRAYARLSEDADLTDDQKALARLLVTDASRKALAPMSIEGVGDLSGSTEGSFSANGFEQSWKLPSPNGTAYFDRETLRAFMRSLGRSQAMGTVLPSYGGAR